MKRKYRAIMTIIVSIVTFIGVIVLTNDAFDDFEGKNVILITLVLILVGIGFYNLYISPKE